MSGQPCLLLEVGIISQTLPGEKGLQVPHGKSTSCPHLKSTFQGGCDSDAAATTDASWHLM